MGKIIKKAGTIGHVIGISGKSLLCHKLDKHFNFVYDTAGGKPVQRVKFSCQHDTAEQIGFMDGAEEIMKF